MLIKKFIAGTTAAAFLLSTLSAPFAQAGFWEERRQAVQEGHQSFNQKSQIKNQKLQYARLPIDLPAISHANQTTWTQETPGFSSLKQKFSESDVKNLPASLKTIPSSYGDVHKIHASQDVQAPLIVLVQDAHGVLSAQKNIARMLDHMAEENKNSLLVGIEGAYKDFDVDSYRDLAHQDVHREVNEFLFQNSLITGAEYFGLMSKQKPVLWGVENPELYAENVQAYRDSEKIRAQADQAYTDLKQAMAPLKKKIYSKELLDYDKKLWHYTTGEIGLVDFIDYLVAAPFMGLIKTEMRPILKDESAATPPVNRARTKSLFNVSKGFPQVSLFMQVLQMEKALHFKTIEKQRASVIEQLAKKLGKAELQNLMDMSLSYRAGQITHGRYYSRLTALLGKAGVSLKTYQAFNAYVAYVIKAEQINPEKLFNEIEQLKDTLAEDLAKTPQQKELVHISKDLMLTGKLLRHELSPEEWRSYKSRRKDVYGISGKIKSLTEDQFKRSLSPHPAPSPLNGRGNNGRGLHAYLPTYEAFYQAATKRDKALVENLLKKQREKSKGGLRFSNRKSQIKNQKSSKMPLAILITGGFHTPGLERELKKRNASYVVCRPKIEEIGKATGYLDVLSSKPTPIENMLLGEKLFTAPPSAHCAFEMPIEGKPITSARAQMTTARCVLSPVVASVKGVFEPVRAQMSQLANQPIRFKQIKKGANEAVYDVLTAGAKRYMAFVQTSDAENVKTQYKALLKKLNIPVGHQIELTGVTEMSDGRQKAITIKRVPLTRGQKWAAVYGGFHDQASAWIQTAAEKIGFKIPEPVPETGSVSAGPAVMHMSASMRGSEKTEQTQIPWLMGLTQEQASEWIGPDVKYNKMIEIINDFNHRFMMKSSPHTEAEDIKRREEVLIENMAGRMISEAKVPEKKAAALLNRETQRIRKNRERRPEQSDQEDIELVRGEIKRNPANDPGKAQFDLWMAGVPVISVEPVFLQALEARQREFGSIIDSPDDWLMTLPDNMFGSHVTDEQKFVIKEYIKSYRRHIQEAAVNSEVNVSELKNFTEKIIVPGMAKRGIRAWTANNLCYLACLELLELPRIMEADYVVTYFQRVPESVQKAVSEVFRKKIAIHSRETEHYNTNLSLEGSKIICSALARCWLYFSDTGMTKHRIRRAFYAVLQKRLNRRQLPHDFESAVTSHDVIGRMQDLNIIYKRDPYQQNAQPTKRERDQIIHFRIVNGQITSSEALFLKWWFEAKKQIIAKHKIHRASVEKSARRPPQPIGTQKPALVSPKKSAPEKPDVSMRIERMVGSMMIRPEENKGLVVSVLNELARSRIDREQAIKQLNDIEGVREQMAANMCRNVERLTQKPALAARLVAGSEVYSDEYVNHFINEDTLPEGLWVERKAGMTDEAYRETCLEALLDHPACYTLNNQGTEIGVIPVKNLSFNTGNAAVIGLGAVYGIPVIYVDSDYHNHTKGFLETAYIGRYAYKAMSNGKRNISYAERIINHDLFEISEWNTKRRKLKIDWWEMGQWMRENPKEAGELAVDYHKRANKYHSVDFLIDEEKEGIVEGFIEKAKISGLFHDPGSEKAKTYLALFSKINTDYLKGISFALRDDEKIAKGRIVVHPDMTPKKLSDEIGRHIVSKLSQENELFIDFQKTWMSANEDYFSDKESSRREFLQIFRQELSFLLSGRKKPSEILFKSQKVLGQSPWFFYKVTDTGGKICRPHLPHVACIAGMKPALSAHIETPARGTSRPSIGMQSNEEAHVLAEKKRLKSLPAAEWIPLLPAEALGVEEDEIDEIRSILNKFYSHLSGEDAAGGITSALAREQLKRCAQEIHRVDSDISLWVIYGLILKILDEFDVSLYELESDDFTFSSDLFPDVYQEIIKQGLKHHCTHPNKRKVRELLCRVQVILHAVWLGDVAEEQAKEVLRQIDDESVRSRNKRKRFYEFFPNKIAAVSEMLILDKVDQVQLSADFMGNHEAMRIAAMLLNELITDTEASFLFWRTFGDLNEFDDFLSKVIEIKKDSLREKFEGIAAVQPLGLDKSVVSEIIERVFDGSSSRGFVGEVLSNVEKLAHKDTSLWAAYNVLHQLCLLVNGKTSTVQPIDRVPPAIAKKIQTFSSTYVQKNEISKLLARTWLGEINASQAREDFLDIIATGLRHPSTSDVIDMFLKEHIAALPMASRNEKFQKIIKQKPLQVQEVMAKVAMKRVSEPDAMFLFWVAGVEEEDAHALFSSAKKTATSIHYKKRRQAGVIGLMVTGLFLCAGMSFEAGDVRRFLFMGMAGLSVLVFGFQVINMMRKGISVAAQVFFGQIYMDPRLNAFEKNWYERHEKMHVAVGSVLHKLPLPGFLMQAIEEFLVTFTDLYTVFPAMFAALSGSPRAIFVEEKKQDVLPLVPAQVLQTLNPDQMKQLINLQSNLRALTNAAVLDSGTDTSISHEPVDWNVLTQSNLFLASPEYVRSMAARVLEQMQAMSQSVDKDNLGFETVLLAQMTGHLYKAPVLSAVTRPGMASFVQALYVRVTGQKPTAEQMAVLMKIANGSMAKRAALPEKHHLLADLRDMNVSKDFQAFETRLAEMALALGQEKHQNQGIMLVRSGAKKQVESMILGMTENSPLKKALTERRVLIQEVDPKVFVSVKDLFAENKFDLQTPLWVATKTPQLLDLTGLKNTLIQLVLWAITGKSIEIPLQNLTDFLKATETASSHA